VARTVTVMLGRRARSSAFVAAFLAFLGSRGLIFTGMPGRACPLHVESLTFLAVLPPFAVAVIEHEAEHRGETTRPF
jgi:hypothetical protein